MSSLESVSLSELLSYSVVCGLIEVCPSMNRGRMGEGEMSLRAGVTLSERERVERVFSRG